MPTATKAHARRPVARKEPTPAEHLNSALVHLLRAVPVGHLDKRLEELEKWVTRLEKDVAKAFAPAPRRRGPVAHTTRATTVTRGRARKPAPRRPVARRAR